MTPVIVALFDDYGIAERVRTQLVADAGIPTDRVELTSLAETGQADSEPGDAFVARVANYFHTLLDQDGRSGGAEELARRVRAGNSAITVHPRLDYEFDSVREILHRNKPVAVEEIR